MSEKTETVGCRRWIESEGNCCSEPAAYIVWGKLFKPEHLGPRCKSCFLIEHPEIRIYRLDQYAVYKLPPANQEPQVQPDGGERERLREISDALFRTGGQFYRKDAEFLRALADQQPSEQANSAGNVGSCERCEGTGEIEQRVWMRTYKYPCPECRGEQ